MKWFASFIKQHKGVTAALVGALLVAAGVPAYLALPLSDVAVEAVIEKVAEEQEAKAPEPLPEEIKDTFEQTEP